MSKKTFNLITAVLGGVSAIASAVVTYAQPANAAAIVASVTIADTAILEICNQFVKTDSSND